MKIVNVVGARPNFMKLAPVIRAMKEADEAFEPLIVHTGQHYDTNMSEDFFKQLEIPQPDVNLGVGSASHAEQTAKIMIAFEKYLMDVEPGLIMVYGDVNSTIACALVAAKLGTPVAHVEAGLRSFDRTMPEEINRILTDAISDLLFTTEESANRNLVREGIPEEKIHFVGNVMIDTLQLGLVKIDGSPLPFKELSESEYGLITLHRPSNVDNPEVLSKILDSFIKMSGQVRLVFPLHPRTRRNIERFGLGYKLAEISKNGIVSGPIGYMEMLRMMKSAKLVVTDSGGIQEETTYLGVPCITLRENTERPSTVDVGTNVLVGNPQAIEDVFNKIMSGTFKKGEKPPLWDGKAAKRIVRILAELA